MKYIKISDEMVPNGVRFDVNQADAGQIVERAYGGFGRAEHDSGAPYMRIRDFSTRKMTFYKLAKHENLSID